MRRLTELEGVALGIVYKREPCTAYSLRRELRGSPSSHWRASAGAIYPLLARLGAEGFVTSAGDADDRRGRKLLSITPLGRRALKAWIKAIADPDLISEVLDPLRTRIFFLGALTSAEQSGLAQDVLAALQQHLTNTREHLAERPAPDDLFEHLGAMGGVMNAESRIAVLKAILVRIRSERGPGTRR